MRKFIYNTNRGEIKPTPENPKGEVHEEFGCLIGNKFTRVK